MAWGDKEAICEYTETETHWFQLVSGKQGKVLRKEVG
jgi:hypothetical protein